MSSSPTPSTPEIRTLRPRTTRLLLLAALLLALALSAWAAHLYVSTANDADLQRRIETLRRDGPPAGSAPEGTQAPAP
ncbi:hypothetical protein GQ464_016190 [Rhodocaloribacter litoris]|uniref:hypothetical protein n=1 Tax=Rhodocaloribacter litoris TaxID=2558931 RepID=UPI001E318B90|nr:hypothetical protein [Rhodocaloribacter litoris]QXD14936.1 hypothetical protein GQ464_016190 [Rhodocaloribacter litoris]